MWTTVCSVPTSTGARRHLALPLSPRMPELPEVEIAVRALRRHAEGRIIARLELRHDALRRALSPARRRALAGARVARVSRRGKHQLIVLDDGRTLLVHFRMTGSWRPLAEGEAPPALARAVLHFADAPRLAFIDPRALGTFALYSAGAPPALALGLEADDPALDGRTLQAALAAKRSGIKPALLDQRVVAGIGNIYASESLWRARIEPFRAAATLTRAECARLVRAMRCVLARALREPGRYAEGESAPLDVYEREGAPCRRCGEEIVRRVQAARSTYWCTRCQR